MLDKLKEIGSQVAIKTSDAVDGITTTVRDGMESLASSASSMTDSLNEKAVRASVSQVCSILQLALEEMKNKPLANQRVSLTASVNIGIAALEVQVHVDPEKRDVPTQT